MKMVNTEAEAQLSGIDAKAFNFEMNAKMYDMLISKLYKNKAGAVIRELAANAWDAHVEAGNTDVPFEMELPTWLSKSFSIRDYGTGIPHEKFEQIYTNIGASTKEGTNALIGGFGLGSKTPFTMTDTFTVENICNGEKSIWLCFKSSGEPQVSMLSKEPCDSRSGLKVAFTFAGDSVVEFTAEIVKQLRYFPVKPIVTGGEGDIQWVELPDDWETKDYFFTNENSGYYHRNHYVVMGNVCYKLSEDDVDYKYRNLFHTNLTLKVPIGAVDIPPSREHLEMTDRTKRALNTYLDTIYEHYVADFMAKVDECEVYRDLQKLCFQSNWGLLGTVDTITWDGTEYKARNLRYTSFDAQGLVVKKIMSSYANVYRSSAIHMSTLVDNNFTLYVNDLGRGNRKHINAEYDKLTTKDAYILEPGSYKSADKDDVIDALVAKGEEVIGKKPLLLSSVLGFPVIQKGTTKGRAKPNQFFKVRASRYDKLKATAEPYTGDVPKTGYFIEISNWSTAGEASNRTDNFDSLSCAIDVLGLEVYYVRKPSIPLVKDSLKGYDTLMKDMKEPLETIVERELDVIHKLNNLPNILNSLQKLDWKVASPSIHLLLSYQRRLNNVKKTLGNAHYTTGGLYPQRSTKAFKPSTYTTRVDDLIAVFKEDYKDIFEALNYGWRTDEAIAAFHKFLLKIQPQLIK